MKGIAIMSNPLKQGVRCVAFLFLAALSMSATLAQNNWERATAIDVSRDGTYVAIGRANGTFEVWTRGTMQLIRSFEVSSRGFASIDWSPTADDIVAFADHFGAVRIMNVTTGVISYEISPVEGVADLAWSPDGARLAGAARFAIAPPIPAVLVWDAITGEVLHRLARHNEIIQSVDWSPDGGRIVSSGADGRIVVWDVATESILHEILFEERNVEEVIWSPDGTKFAARSRGYSGGVNYESDIRIWNAANANLLATFPNSGIFDWDWSPTGQLMAIADNTETTHTIEIFNVANGQTVSVIQETDNIYRLTWTADGGEIVYNAGSAIKSQPAPPTDLITNITVANGKVYTRDTVAVGKTLYIDRTYSFVTVPAAYVGREYIRTANDDKQNTSANFLTFTLTADAWVYVMYDSRVANANLPGWLKGWIDTGETIVATEFNNTQLARRVFKRRYAAGSVTLGGNASGGTNVMYNVIAVPDPRNETSLYRVNAGGPEVVSGNIIWNADNYFTGGTANNLPAPDVLNTADDIL
jgi:hypothetical protein